MNYISLKTTTVMWFTRFRIIKWCCNYIIQIDKMKLKLHKGNLEKFVEICPETLNHISNLKVRYGFFSTTKFLEGVKSRGKFLIKMDNVSLTYPGNKVPTIRDITVRASMASR